MVAISFTRQGAKLADSTQCLTLRLEHARLLSLGTIPVHASVIVKTKVCDYGKRKTHTRCRFFAVLVGVLMLFFPFFLSPLCIGDFQQLFGTRNSTKPGQSNNNNNNNKQTAVTTTDNRQQQQTTNSSNNNNNNKQQ